MVGIYALMEMKSSREWVSLIMIFTTEKIYPPMCVPYIQMKNIGAKASRENF